MGKICQIALDPRRAFGTVQKQLGARWQKISPPQQAPQICLPAQPVFEQASFMWEEHCYE
jgi:hypothetical protein